MQHQQRGQDDTDLHTVVYSPGQRDCWQYLILVMDLGEAHSVERVDEWPDVVQPGVVHAGHAPKVEARGGPGGQALVIGHQHLERSRWPGTGSRPAAPGC